MAKKLQEGARFARIENDTWIMENDRKDTDSLPATTFSILHYPFAAGVAPPHLVTCTYKFVPKLVLFSRFCGVPP
jgi:hypothetical protein